MTDAPKPADDDAPSSRGSTPVPPRGGKGRPGRPAPGRPAAARPNRPGGGRPAPGGGATKGRQARQAAQRRNRLYGVVAIVAVIAIVAVVVIVSVASGGGGKPRQPAPAAAVSQMKNIPMSTLVAAVKKVSPSNLYYASPAAGGALTAQGKPEILFIGAEYCPICAAERWPMTMALMKFGTFTNLQQTHSAQADGDAGTWSYYGAAYTSQYLTFKPYELYTNQPSGNGYKSLDSLPAADQRIWTANLGQNVSFPFIDFAGKEVLTSAQYNPQLIYYHDFNYVLGSVGSNDNSVGAQIDAAAAVFTKYICGLTGDKPGSVCSAVANVAAPVTSSSSGSSTPAG